MESIFKYLQSDALVAYLKGLNEHGVYLFLAVSSVVENVFPPWPGDTVTVFGGVLIAHGVVSPWISMLALIVGNLIGAFIMYYAGTTLLSFARRIHSRFEHPHMVHRILEELVSDEAMSRTEYWFKRWGVAFVLLSRFSAGIRFFVSIIAGISRMNILVFSLFFTLGVIIWNTLLLGGGYVLGTQWNRILDWLRLYNIIVISLMVLGVVGFFVVRHYRKKQSAGDAGV